MSSSDCHGEAGADGVAGVASELWNATQPYVVCRFNGLHLRNPCKYVDYDSVTDPGGMEG